MKPVLIWTYHRVLPEPAAGAVDVTVFEKQIAFLKKAGYEFIDTPFLQKWFNGEADRSKKYTMFTFDDAWADNLIWATPILKKYDAKAVMAVNTSLVNPQRRSFKLSEKPENYKIIKAKEALEKAVFSHEYHSFLTWEELQELKETGIWDIQAHGNSHLGCYQSLEKIRGFYPNYFHWTMEHALREKAFYGAPRAEFRSILADPETIINPELKEALKKETDNEKRKKLCTESPSPLQTAETDEEFIKRITRDLMTCKEALQEKLDIASDSMFWPWGHYSELSKKTAEECGFKLLFTMDKAAVYKDSDPMQIPRIAAPETIGRFKKQVKVFSSPFLTKLRELFS